jgi:molybdopterin synthase catalytic subunit
MKVTVLLFAGLRDRLGTETIELDIDAGTSADELLALLARAHPEIAGPLGHCRVAIYQGFARGHDTIDAPVEIAVIPPVSGGLDHAHAKGGGDPPRYLLTEAPLEPARVTQAVTHAHAGGVTSFIGNVRKSSHGHSIAHLEYDAYRPMALRVIREIGATIETEVPGARVAIHHRLGRLKIGESAVVIAASAAHRAEAFQACRAAIEALKRDVPIWKREVADSGETWYGRGP